MGKDSKIEWTDHTWNPWRGCHKVSAGCKNCYMFRDQKRYGRNPNVVVRAASSTFNAPLKWKEPAKVFTCSWSDWAIEEADDWRSEAEWIIRTTPHLTYLILTKRIDRMYDLAREIEDEFGQSFRDIFPNVWLGVTVEDQKAAYSRRHSLGSVSAAKKFVSYEPAIGPVNWEGWEFIDWLIAGGESGTDARVMAPEWVRAARDWAKANDKAFFFKQWGDWKPDVIHEAGVMRRSGWNPEERRGGYVLDGKEWKEFPK